MKKYLFFLAFLLVACGAEGGTPSVKPTPSLSPGEIALNMIQQQMAAEATAQIVGLQFTATAQVIGVTATSQYVATQQAVTEQARIDAIATSDQARRDAAAEQARKDTIATAEQARIDAQNATAQALVALQSTQAAEATSTFTAMTLTALPPHATLTQQAINNDIVLAAKDVELAELSLQQARDTNRIQWQIPLLAALVVMILGTVWVLRESRWKVIKTDDGDVIGFGFHEQFVNPNLLPGPVLDLKAKTVPMLTDPDTQREIVRNEQKIRAIAAIPINPNASGAQAYDLAFANEKKEDPFEIVDAVPESLMDGEAMKAADRDWRKANE